MADSGRFPPPLLGRSPWFVSARSGQAALADGPRSPVGTQHARTAGASSTACGLSTIGWVMFWELRFPADPRRSCAACIKLVNDWHKVSGAGVTQTAPQGQHESEARVAVGRRGLETGPLHHLEKPLRELAVKFEQVPDKSVVPVDRSRWLADGQSEHLQLQAERHADKLALGRTAAHQAVKGRDRNRLRSSRRVERLGLESLLHLTQHIRGKHSTHPLRSIDPIIWLSLASWLGPLPEGEHA